MPENRLIPNFSKKQFLGSTLYWLLRALSHLLTGPRRFLLVSPPWLRSQLIFDTANLHFLKVHIRDWVEYRTLCEIFLSECYGFRKFKRSSEINTFHRKLQSSKSTPLILDLGGNVGLASRYFVETFPDALVVCVEPVGANIAQARTNNGDRVIFIEAAVGSAKSKGNIFDPKLGNDAFRVVLDHEGPVEIVSVTDILGGALVGSVPFIVKIDIEGFENELFSKDTDWIDQFPILIIELHDWMFPRNANSSAFLQAISGRNRDFVYQGENIFSFSNTLF